MPRGAKRQEMYDILGLDMVWYILGAKRLQEAGEVWQAAVYSFRSISDRGSDIWIN